MKDQSALSAYLTQMDDDPVGYRKPPTKHRWKPGQSGNPRGRPRKPRPALSIDDAEIIRRLDAEEIIVGGTSMPKREAEIRRLFQLALKGNRKARRLMEKLKRVNTTTGNGGVVRIPWENFGEIQ